MRDKALISLGNVIRKRREDKDLSQEELAERAAVHRNYIGLVERAERNITLKTILAIAKALGVKASILMDEANL